MRFDDVTERLGAIVNYPSDAADGKPLNVAIPHLADARIWQARHGGYTWVIAYEPGVPGWTEKEKREWIGYTASYRRVGHATSSQTIRIDGVFRTLAEAEAACVRQWKLLRNAA